MSVQHILDQKRTTVILLPKAILIADVAKRLSAENVGTVMLTDQDGHLAGIISERDIIRAFAKDGEKVDRLKAQDLMTPQVVTCTPETSLVDVLAMMSRHSIRHLPVLREHHLVGLISVRDVLDAQQDMLRADIQRRKQDAQRLQDDRDVLEKAFAARTAELEESENRYRNLIEGSQLGIRIERKGAELLFVNCTCAQMFGFDDPRDYAAAQTAPGKFIAPHDRDRMLANMKARAEGKPALDEYEYDALKKDGSIIPVQVFVREITWDGEAALHRIFIDISKRRNAEEKLRESEAHFRAFFDNSPSVMYAKDRDLNITFVNAKYLDFHKVREGDVVGQRGGSTLGKSKRANVEELDRKVMSDGTTAISNVPMTSKAGDTRDFLVMKFPIHGADGEVTGIGGINTDVTELHKREEQLVAAKFEAEKLAEKAEAANRSKSQFLATMSHEIRTPMNGVLGMADLLARTDLNADQRDFVQTIRESGRTLLDLLNDILDLSKIEAGRIEFEAADFSITALLDATNALWAHSANDKGLAFSIHNKVTDIDMVRSDRTRLRQVLNNLIGNAIKFTSDGKIEVHAGTRPGSDGKIDLQFEVRDTGIGVSEKQKKKLFQPFTQADSSTTRQYGGTGLGLTISKNLVELLGGEIGLESTPGKGSNFWVTVPVEQGTAENTKYEPATENPTLPVKDLHDRTLRILIAEDNHINQKVVSWLLTPLNCQFDIVGNGLEAVAAVTRLDYDLILMDVQMPEMDGITATKKIRAMAGPKGQIPIVAMTANAMQGDREKYLQAGLNDYVPKPIDQRDLLGAISRTAGIAMPDLDEPADFAPMAGGEANQPLDEDAAEEINTLIGNLDDLLDGTG